jgi:uncharacterized membrane protein
MRTIFIFIVCVTSIFMMNTPERKRGEHKALASLNVDTAYFKNKIQPILQKNCTPCHFPGGKMYTKMPFDKGETIVSHEAGVLKRIKKEDEVSLIKQFIQQSK